MNKCNQKCEVYSRVCGYFRPVSNWNHGKREEFKDRKTYKTATRKTLVALFVLSVLSVLCGCSHNVVSYGDGIMLETTINPETYALGVSLRYGKILTVCVRENVKVEMEGAGSGTAGAGVDKSNTTGANATGKITVQIGPQVTGYYVDAVKAGAKAEDIDKYVKTESEPTKK